MFTVLSFYKFHAFSPGQLEAIEENLQRFADAHSLLGLVILAEEGINATVAGSDSTAEQLRSFVTAQLDDKQIVFKESHSENPPFRRFRIKVREEIVTLGRKDVEVAEHANALSPEEWHAQFESDEPFVLLDTRNAYETRLGMFKGAIDPEIANFADLSEKIKELDIPKDRKVLMYCTGGIRCEKALPLLQSEGFKRVYQLSGGILNYMEQFPDGYYEGECFVFDHRVSLDQNLNPSERYRLCPLCGMPCDEPITCLRCGTVKKVCGDCLSEDRQFCSIRCENELHFIQSKSQK